MDVIHNASVSWPLGVRSATSFNTKVTTVRKPRAQTAPVIGVNDVYRKKRYVKKGETLEDLSPRTNKMLQKGEIALVKPEVPALRDILEILTCYSSRSKQSRAHSADRVRIIQKTAQKRGVPLSAAEVALKTSRRYRHPERLEANLPVTPLRLVKSAHFRDATQDFEDNLERLTEYVSKLSNTKNETDTCKNVYRKAGKDDILDDKQSDKTDTDSIEDHPKDGSSQQIVNIVDDAVNDHLVSRENVPTIASGTAGAPPPPPSTPELHKVPATPVEKALKHNSATYTYKRHQRKSRAQSLAETKKIIYEMNVETLTPFPAMKTMGYNKNPEYFNDYMNIMSRNTLEQLYNTKNYNKGTNILSPVIQRQMTMSSAHTTRINKVPLEKENKYVSVTTIRPFTKPVVLFPASSTANYVSIYDINGDSVPKVPQRNLNNTTSTSSSTSQETTLQNQISSCNESDKCTPINNRDIFDTAVNRGENVDIEKRGKRSTHTVPIVIPLVPNDNCEGISGSKLDDTDIGGNARTKAKHVTLELNTDARITRDRNSHLISRQKTGILKVR